MKTLFYFALTAFICSFCPLANIGNPDSPYFFVLLESVPLLLFLRHLNHRWQQRDTRRRRAYLQEQYMHTYLRNNGIGY